MKFIRHSEIEAGDTVAWAFDRSLASGSEIIYYEVETVDHQDKYTTIVYGKSYGSGGERWATVDRKWDMVPNDRNLLLISRPEKIIESE